MELLPVYGDADGDVGAGGFLMSEVPLCTQDTGVPRSEETAPPWDPTVGICLLSVDGDADGDVGAGGFHGRGDHQLRCASRSEERTAHA